MKSSASKLFQIHETNLPGCYEIQPIVRPDARGRFVKTYHETAFDELGLPTDFGEEYYSVSTKGVLRGLHFQLPPADHEKLVYCTEGRVMDVALDIRRGSPTYGKYHIFELDAEKANMAYLPKGMAHGFCVLSDSATMMYKVTSEYAPQQDAGILWNSVGIPWPVAQPILSERDQAFVSLDNFDSPFIYGAGTGGVARVLLTGITGFVGLNLAERLVQDGYEVYGVVRESSKLDRVYERLGNKVKLCTHKAGHDLNAIMDEVKPDIVYHLASLYLPRHSYSDIRPMLESNITFGTELVDAMTTHGCYRLVNTGTSWQHYQNAEYSPVNLYAASKQAFLDMLEYYEEISSLHVMNLQLFDTYGPGDTRRKILALLKEVSEKGAALAMSGGEQLIDMVYIDDVVDAFIQAGKLLLRNRYDKCGTYAVSSGKPLPLRDLVKAFADTSGRKLFIDWGKRPYREREVMVPWNTGKSLPGWTCKISLNEGIKRYLNIQQTSDGGGLKHNKCKNRYCLVSHYEKNAYTRNTTDEVVAA